MAEGAYGTMGIAQAYALIFGLAYLAVAVLELLFSTSEPLVIGEATIVAGGAVHIVIHFAVAFLVLGSYFAGESAARMVARIMGITFVLVSLLNLFASDFYLGPGGRRHARGTGQWHARRLYLVHIATALAALYAGFATRSEYGPATA